MFVNCSECKTWIQVINQVLDKNKKIICGRCINQTNNYHNRRMIDYDIYEV